MPADLTPFDLEHSTSIEVKGALDALNGAIGSGGGGGGTEYVEDVAAPTDPTAGAIVFRRRDSLVTEVSAAGNWVIGNATAKGEQYVKHLDPITLAAGALGTVQIGDGVDTALVEATGELRAQLYAGGVPVSVTLPAATFAPAIFVGLETLAALYAYDAAGVMYRLTGDPTNGLDVDVTRVQGTVTVAGAVSVSNFPATQPVSGTVAVSGNVDVTPASPAASDYLPIRLTDGSAFYTASGGGGAGTEYTEGATDATITGPALMWEDSADTLRAVSAAKPLPIRLTDGTDLAAIDATGELRVALSYGGLQISAGLPSVDSIGPGAVVALSAAALGYLFDGTNWNRARGDLTNGLDVDVTRVSGTVTVAGTVTANVGTGTQPVSGTVAATQSGTWTLGAGAANIGDVDVLSLPALPAGTNNIGDVDVLTLPALVAGAAEIGRVRITDGTDLALVEATGELRTQLYAGGTPVSVTLPTPTIATAIFVGMETIAALYAYNGTDMYRLLGDTTNGLDVDVTRVTGTVTVDSELPAPIVPALTMANTAAPQVIAETAIWTGTTWNPWHNAQSQPDGASGGAFPPVGNWVYNGATWDRMRGTIAAGLLVDTELETAAALADGQANPTVPRLGAMNSIWNPTAATWARWQSASGLADGAAGTGHGVVHPTIYNAAVGMERMRSLGNFKTAAAAPDGGLLAVQLANRLYTALTLATAVASVQSWDVNGAGDTMLYCAATTTGTVAVEVSADGTNWVAADIMDTALNAMVPGGTFTPTANKVYRVHVTGYRLLRVRVTVILGATVAFTATLAGQHAFVRDLNTPNLPFTAASGATSAPAAAAVIADTGALAAGDWEFVIQLTAWDSTAAVGKGMGCEHRDAANAATLRRYGGVQAGDSAEFRVPRIALAASERVRVIQGAVAGAASSTYIATILHRRVA